MTQKGRMRLIGLAGVLLIAAFYGLMVRAILQQRSQQTALYDQLAALEGALGEQPSDDPALATRQAELVNIQNEQATVATDLAAVQQVFPSETDSTEILAHIITTAAIYNVNLHKVQAQDPITITVDTSLYRLLAYDIQVEGETETLSAFLTALENGPFGTLSLDEVRLVASPTQTPVTSDSTTPEPLALYQASLVIQIYVRLADERTTPLPPTDTAVFFEKQTRQLETLLAQAYQARDWEWAIRILLALRQLYPDDADLTRQLVEAYVRQGEYRLTGRRYEQAAEDFAAALALQPDNPEALAGIATLTALTPIPASVSLETPSPGLTPPPEPTP